MGNGRTVRHELDRDAWAKRGAKGARLTSGGGVHLRRVSCCPLRGSGPVGACRTQAPENTVARDHILRGANENVLVGDLKGRVGGTGCWHAARRGSGS